MTHTPGPWFTSEADSEHTTEVAVCDKNGIIAMCGDAFGPFGREHRDNARLIAAAPDMLAALKECEEYFDNRADADGDSTGFTPNAEMNMLVVVRSAIAKAISP